MQQELKLQQYFTDLLKRININAKLTTKGTPIGVPLVYLYDIFFTIK